MGSKDNSKNTEISSKSELTSEFTDKVTQILYSFEPDEIQFIKQNIFNNLFDNHDEEFKTISLIEDEETLYSLVKSILYITSEKRIKLLNYKNVFSEYISHFLMDFAIGNIDVKEQQDVEQVVFSKQNAVYYLDFVEGLVITENRQNAINYIRQIPLPTGSDTRDETNKEIILFSYCAAYNTMLPRKIYSFFMNLDIATFNKMLDALQEVLFHEVAYESSKMISFNIDLPEIENRLLHGLRLYHFLFIKNQIDLNLDMVTEDHIIKIQMDIASMEGDTQEEIPFTEEEIDLAVKELKDTDKELSIF